MTNPTKTRILYIGMIPPEVGGQEAGGIATHVWELAMEAHKRGYEVHILANTISSFTKDGINVIAPPQESKLIKGFHALNQWFKIDKKSIISLDFLNLREKIGVLYQAYYLQQILESAKPDLIHVHSFRNEAPLSLSILKNRPPVVITDHGIGTVYEYDAQEVYGIKNKNYLSKIVEESAKRVNYAIIVSEFSKAQLKENFGLPDTLKIKAIPNPLNVNEIPLFNKVETREALGLKNKKVIFFSAVSHPIERKGLDILLKAFDSTEYLREKCKLLVVTNEETTSFVREFVERKNIDGLILGPQPWEKLVEYHNTADIFVMPSKIEGIGIVYEEALSTGTPIIGFPESVKELENLLGIYIGEKFDAWNEDEKMLAEKIIKVLDTDFDRELLRKKVIENLSWDAKFAEFDSIYKELLQTGNKHFRGGNGI